MEWVAGVLLLLAGLLWLLAQRARRGTGLPTGRVVYSDTGGGTRPPRALFSEALRLTGKPDYLVRHQLHDRPCRFDVVAIDGPVGEATVSVYPHAFIS